MDILFEVTSNYFKYFLRKSYTFIPQVLQFSTPLLYAVRRENGRLGGLDYEIIIKERDYLTK